MFSFPEGWRSNLDWIAWLQLAGEPGAFAYVPRALVHRTLHADAATTRELGIARAKIVSFSGACGRHRLPWV